ncbi:MAG TPA: sugar phosphate isomerase/epimerase family protein [Verrucomicrobiae bacterium]|nr:sugar phosphate isomerase/epimerase family protein [Verrucomicrobiae bacterium]
MGYYTAINYWVLGGFEGKKSAAEAIRDASSMGLGGVELTFGDCLKTDITDKECAAIASEARHIGVGLRTLASGHYWGCSLSSPDRAERDKAVAFTLRYLEVAKALGAETVLVVPGAVDVAWDPSRPIVPYRAAWEHATDSLRRCLSAAEKLGVNIALENVWNKFLLGPFEFRQFIDQFGSARIGSYFDIGNAVITGYPEHWIEILGDRIKAIHVKNFKRQDCGGVLGGFGDDLLIGDVNYDAVKAQLAAIGFTGPATTEMIPFCRLPNMILPDMDLARKTAAALKQLFP